MSSSQSWQNDSRETREHVKNQNQVMLRKMNECHRQPERREENGMEFLWIYHAHERASKALCMHVQKGLTDVMQCRLITLIPTLFLLLLLLTHSL